MPLEARYGKLNEVFIEDFNRYFGQLSDKKLEGLVEEIILECTKAPTIAQVNKLRKIVVHENGERPSELYAKLLKEKEDKQEKARKEALNFINGEAGNKAANECYYTELFGYLYDTALSQITNNREVYLKIPDPIPKDWLQIGAFVKCNLSKPSR